MLFGRQGRCLESHPNLKVLNKCDESWCCTLFILGRAMPWHGSTSAISRYFPKSQLSNNQSKHSSGQNPIQQKTCQTFKRLTGLNPLSLFLKKERGE
jgi:hypothetical protein